MQVEFDTWLTDEVEKENERRASLEKAETES
jgi:hypothetical protein